MDRAYFENYCGYGPYDENYLLHSGIEHCISIVSRFEIPVRSVLVLGAATGRVLEHFDAAWSPHIRGCEISAWAHARIPPRYRRRIERADMRRYVPRLLRARRSFDLLFCNSLVYLEAREVPDFVDLLSRVAGHLHFRSSVREDFEPGDARRVTLRSYGWWNRTFRDRGFSRTRSRYLWRSRRRGDF